MAADKGELEIKMDKDGLYKEEVFTDRRVGTIQRLTPVDHNGDTDASRDVVFEIPAASLGEAADNFGDSANIAVEEAMQRLEELRREAASSIIVPGTDVPGGAVPSGGQIKMP